MEESSLKDTLFSYMSRLHNKGDVFLCDELKKRGITGLVYSHISIIAILSIYKVLSMKEVSEKISKDKSTVTTLVNKLVKLDYVKKSISLEDKRVIFLSLEKKADEITEIISEVSQIFEKKVETILGPCDIDLLMRILNKLVNNF